MIELIDSITTIVTDITTFTANKVTDSTNITDMELTRNEQIFSTSQIMVSSTESLAESCNSEGEYNGEYGITHWPKVSEGELSLGECNYGNGFANWLCLQNGSFDNNGPDFTECWLDIIVNDMPNITDINDVNEILEIMVQNTNDSYSLNTSKELNVSIFIIKQLQNYVELHNNEIDFSIARNLSINFVNLFSKLINQKNEWNNSTNNEKTEMASDILLYNQFTSFTLSNNQNITNELEVISHNNIVKTLHTSFSHEIIFEANESSIIIPKVIYFESNNSCNNSAVGVLINKLGLYLFNGLQDGQQINTNIIAFSAIYSIISIQLSNGLKARIRLIIKIPC